MARCIRTSDTRRSSDDRKDRRGNRDAARRSAGRPVRTRNWRIRRRRRRRRSCIPAARGIPPRRSAGTCRRRIRTHRRDSSPLLRGRRRHRTPLRGDTSTTDNRPRRSRSRWGTSLRIGSLHIAAGVLRRMCTSRSRRGGRRCRIRSGRPAVRGSLGRRRSYMPHRKDRLGRRGNRLARRTDNELRRRRRQQAGRPHTVARRRIEAGGQGHRGPLYSRPARAERRPARRSGFASFIRRIEFQGRECNARASEGGRPESLRLTGKIDDGGRIESARFLKNPSNSTRTLRKLP